MQPASPAGPVFPVADGVRVALRVTPRASRNALTGLAATAEGGVVLKVSVTAVAEGGKANDAVIQLLAKTWHLPKSRLTLVLGQSDRSKTLHVSGDPGDLRDRITASLPRPVPLGQASLGRTADD